MKHHRRLALTLISLLFLSGCMYPDSGSRAGGVTTGEYTILVENAIMVYKQRTGVLPIHNSTETTPILEKYRVDFGKLLEYGVLGDVPRDAYENGGNYYYMIVDPEGEIRIKLLDLRASQRIADLQQLVNRHSIEEGALPFGRQTAPHFYTIDFAKLGIPDEQFKSVYSETYLAYLLHESGTVAVQYAPEIMKAMNKHGKTKPIEHEDLRMLLVEQTPLVPVGSFPYRLENGLPVIAER